MKIIVIGSGIAGSSAARVGRAMGHDVTVVDKLPSSSASRVALATIRPSWYGEEDQKLIERSWEHYALWGAAITQEALVSDWKSGNAPKMQGGWWLADPLVPLVAPDVIDEVTSIENTSVKLASGSSIDGDAIYIATGVHDRSFYSAFKPYAGATLISKTAKVENCLLRVHKLRPYYDLTAGMTSDGCRLGSSISVDPEKAVSDVWDMLEIAHNLGIVTKVDDWQLVLHFRAKPTNKNVLRPENGQKVTQINGLHRSGYGLCPALAEKWIRSIE